MKYLLSIILICISILSVLFWDLSFSSIFLTVSSILIIVALLLDKDKIKNKIIKLICIAYKYLVFVFVVSFIIVESLILISIKDNTDIGINENIDTVIVLGAKVNGYEISDTLKLRLDKVVDFYKYNPEIDIIVSGGQGKEELVSEGYAMKKYLISKNKDSQKIIVEDKATTTLENIIYSKKILNKLNQENDKVMVITSDYHLFRAMSIGKILDLNIVSGLCYESSMSTKLYYMIREYPTMIIDLFRSNLQNY